MTKLEKKVLAVQVVTLGISFAVGSAIGKVGKQITDDMVSSEMTREMMKNVKFTISSKE